ncbi:hypothetical protein H5410_003102 [Solanum commersonii]|uniref:Uncharacterized protein n=1 Tax=Solanum commersonii TaxID=4109 RepID=A0A9J6B3V3_SOLCO|nr:hypothetical protein H5410_003102 [Solanum commersonii]
MVTTSNEGVLRELLCQQERLFPNKSSILRSRRGTLLKMIQLKGSKINLLLKISLRHPPSGMPN